VFDDEHEGQGGERSHSGDLLQAQGGTQAEHVSKRNTSGLDS
jgi:hypothetical protein